MLTWTYMKDIASWWMLTILLIQFFGLSDISRRLNVGRYCGCADSPYSAVILSIGLLTSPSITVPTIKKVGEMWVTNATQGFESICVTQLATFKSLSFWSSSEVTSISPFTTVLSEFCAECACHARHLALTHRRLLPVPVLLWQQAVSQSLLACNVIHAPCN